MMWLSLLRRFWPVIVAAIALLSLYGYHRAAIHAARNEGYEQAKADAAIEFDKYRTLRDELEEETQHAHAQELAKLRADAAREQRGRPIRCVLGNADEVRTGQNSGQSAGGSAGESALQPSVDLRSRIVFAGETCERLRQQLIAIKALQSVP